MFYLQGFNVTEWSILAFNTNFTVNVIVYQLGNLGQIGPKGDIGLTGILGIDGIPGAPGQKGEPGLNGTDRRTGFPGDPVSSSMTNWGI